MRYISSTIFVRAFFMSALLLLAHDLGGYDVFDYDEAIHADISHNLLYVNHFVPLRSIGETMTPFYYHPPLFFYLGSLSFYLFGESEASARLVACFFAFTTLIVCYLFSQKIYGSRTAGLFSAFLLLLSSGFFELARRNMTDMQASFLFMLSFYLFFLGIQGKMPSGFFLGGFSTGLALITRFTGIVIYPILLLWTFLGKNRFPKSRVWITLTASLLVFAVFLIPSLVLYPQEVFGGFMLRVNQYAGNTYEPWVQPSRLDDFYLRLLFFVSPTLAALFFIGLLNSLKKSDDSLFPVAAFLIISIVFSFSGIKTERYFLPIIPLMAVIAAGSLKMVEIKEACSLFSGKKNLQVADFVPKFLLIIVLASLILAHIFFFYVSYPVRGIYEKNKAVKEAGISFSTNPSKIILTNSPTFAYYARKNYFLSEYHPESRPLIDSLDKVNAVAVVGSWDDFFMSLPKEERPEIVKMIETEFRLIDEKNDVRIFQKEGGF